MSKEQMEHSFDIEIAEKIGINAAVIYKNLLFWCLKNKANNKHFHDNNYWTYNSVSAFKELFPYLGDSQIKSALKKLEDEGYIAVGNYNKTPTDRTRWFSVIALAKIANATANIANANGENSKCYIEHIINTDVNTDKEEEELSTQIDFINFLKQNFHSVPFPLYDITYYFSQSGYLTEWDSHNKIPSTMAIKLFNDIYENKKMVLEYLQAMKKD